MLPGSRLGEVQRLLPVFIETLRRLQAGRPPFSVAVPLVAHVAPIVRDMLASSGLDFVTINDEADKFDGFAASDLALVKSGTATLELALSRVPAIIAYRLNPISQSLLVTNAVGRYVGLPNIILDREVMPGIAAISMQGRSSRGGAG